MTFSQLIASCKSQNMLMRTYCCARHFCSATFIASEIPYISILNISLFWHKITFHVSYLLTCFQTTTTPISLLSSLHLSYHKLRSAWSLLAILIALHFSSINIFPENTSAGISIIGSTCLTRSMQNLTEIC